MISRVYLPAFLLLALLIGGSARKFVAGDAMLMLAALPLVWSALGAWQRLPNPAKLLLSLPLLLIVLQVLPGTDALSADRSAHALALSRDIGRTLDSLAITVVALAVFLCASAAPAHHRGRILFAILTGIAANMVLSALQLGTAEGFSLGDEFGHEMRAGFFGNRNHLACLLALGAPLAAMLLPGLWAAGWFAAALVLQLALGSDAGIALTILAGAATAFALAPRRFRPALALIALILVAGTMVLRGPGLIGEVRGEISRLTLASDTMDAIARFWPLGSGFGTFEAVYPQVEKPERVIDAIVNHAHNDYLELVLEGGLPALMLIAAYLTCLAVAGRRGLCAGQGPLLLVATAVVLLHSGVDFPLRTMAVLASFAVLNGLLFAPLLQSATERTAVRPSRHDRRRAACAP